MRKSDYKAVCFLLLVIGGMLIAFFAVDKLVVIDGQDNSNKESSQTSLKRIRYYSDYKAAETHLQRFDPNTADSTTLLNLGLPPFVVRSIYKYRSMGGVYSSPEDFARIPGLTQKTYKQLRPYITIADDYKPAAMLVGERTYRHDNATKTSDTIQHVKKLLASERISLNEADTNTLKRVPGIGSYYAKKIVALRNRLGGFTSLDQLLTIKGLPESAFSYLTIPDGGIRKININKASFQQMASHPYIGYARTKAIVDYRRLKGKIKSVRQLSLLPGFTEEDISRMEPYLEY